MSTAALLPRSLILFLCLAILVACQPASPTPIAGADIQVVRITVNDPVTGQIIQVKTFDQCHANSAFNSEVKFTEGRSETTQKELTLSEGASADAEVPLIAKVKLEAAVEERFSAIKQTFQGHEESVTINVPPHTRQEYTITWKETRHEGTIEYTVNGVSQSANYSYRVGLEFVSASGMDVDCSATATPTTLPTQTSTQVASAAATSAVLRTKTLAEDCIFSRTWKPDAPNTGVLSNISIATDGCTALDELGLFAEQGALHLTKETRNNTAAAGIYTPINSNAVIEFSLYINSMSMRFNNNIAEVTFAVTPANDRLAAKSTARFKLHLEDPGNGKVIHFMMADAGENDGVKLGNQHYEYGRTYNIRMLLSANQMDVFINGYRINEKLELPQGAKVFYIGYALPVYTEMDLRVSNLTVDGLAK
jgi:hypothetical protein